MRMARKIESGTRHAAGVRVRDVMRPFLAFLIALVVCALASREASAQTIIGVQNAPYPERYLNYGTAAQQDLTEVTRPTALNPTGINYSDCISDMTLVYTVNLSGFTGQAVEVWVSQNGNDCTQATNRGNNGIADCWLVASLPAVNQPAATNYNIPVRVQDIVGLQQTSPSPTEQVHEGPSACSTQPTETAVQFIVYFIPISGNVSSGTGYQQQINADLVGPTAPLNVSIGDGDTVFILNWTANTDADTGGYDVFVDPIPGSGETEASTTTGTTTTVLVCPDSGSAGASLDATDESAAPASDDSGASDATTSDASDSATMASGSSGSAEAGCYYENVGAPPPPSGTTACGSAVLLSSNVQDGGAAVAATYDDAGNEIDAGSSTSTGSIGISTIPCQYLVGASCAMGQPVYTATTETVTGESGGSYTIKGLTNGVNYNVVVAAVDNYGNVGPPSAEVCATPAPIKDFFKAYSEDGGKAGGGFCALEAVGLPAGTTGLFGGMGVGILAALRRRRRGAR
jgi:hypothetical protein